MKILVTSANKMKVESVKETFLSIFGELKAIEVTGFASSSGVSEQPLTMSETRRGAVNRIHNCPENDADLIVSIESGVERSDDMYYSFTLAAIANKDRSVYGFGVSSIFPIPESISRHITSERVLGSIVHCPDGVISYLTGGRKHRSDLVKEAVLSALIPHNVFPAPIAEDIPKEIKDLYDSVDEDTKVVLSNQIRDLDFSPVEIPLPSPKGTVEPVALNTDPENVREEYYENGVDAVKYGEVAVVIMAGGQGSRLGALIPKALFHLDLPSKPTLLEIQLKKVKKLQKLTSAKWIPVYIMTSEDTHSPILAYLIENNNFGLEHVKLFKQESIPVRLPDGKISISKGKIATAPNGNGSVFKALRESGCLSEMKRMGISYADIHTIDNPLALPADPIFVGATIYEEGDAGIKVVRKTDVHERVGTICKIDGVTSVIEYSEIDPKDASKLIYANTAMMLFSMNVIEKAANSELPYHLAVKKNSEGETVHKFERFIFDALSFCENVSLLEVERDSEFAPIKNASGAGVDCPETAKDLIVKLHKKWARDADCNFEGEGDFEVLPETSYGGEGIEMMGYAGMTFKLPFSI